MVKDLLVQYIIRWADNGLVLGHRLSEHCSRGAELEVDLAVSNMALDLLGQARSLYQYACVVEGGSKTEDDWAYLRQERDYANILLLEQPNTDFAYIVARQFFYDQFHYLFCEALQDSQDETLKAVAQKSLKEVAYHRRWSTEWLLRLGDGTPESRRRMQAAVNDLWAYTHEMFVPDGVDTEMASLGIGTDVAALEPAWLAAVLPLLDEATLTVPQTQRHQKGGKQGIHSEHLGYLLAELQYVQRAYPGLEW